MTKYSLARTLALGAALGAAPLGAAAFSLSTTVNATATSGPTISWRTPAEGGRLSGDVKGPPHCEVTGTNVVRVMFYINGTWTNTDGTLENGLGCWIDTTRYANGTYRLRAVAYDAAGRTAVAERSVQIANSAPAPAASSIAPADIIGWASGNVPFSQQNGYSGQVLGTYPAAASIPEAGVHGTRLPNGETLRLGKETDPANSSRRALAFQLGRSDPHTSGATRAELSFRPTVERNKVYWIAFRAYVRDWGNESSAGLFGTQLHAGLGGVSPAFGLYTAGARNFRVETRYSTSSSPSQSNSITVRHAERPIPFGRWFDMVIKFRLNTSGNGFLQAWMDGTQIVDYRGHLGYNTSQNAYAKFGIYNWASFTNPRKVLLHNPTIVHDPSGSKYTAAALRTHINR